MSEPRYPDGDHVRRICKIGLDAECCRYLTMAPTGWSCEKKSELAKLLDARAKAGVMNARADNCEGMDSR